MYQHIQLKKLSNWSTNATSSKFEGVETLKEKNSKIFFNDDGELALKELSNEMGELEEVILVEDEPALNLPQLSNECWSNFVEELTKKYEQRNGLNFSSAEAFRIDGANNSKSIFLGSQKHQVDITSDEDEPCSPGIRKGKNKYNNAYYDIYIVVH